MGEASIPVDPYNPGQVFACLGFLETSVELLGRAEASFDWSDGELRFRLRADGPSSPIVTVLEFLEHASVAGEAPVDSKSLESWQSAWGPSPIIVEPARGYPFPDPASPASLVCVLTAGDHRIPIEHWGDASGRDNVKFWGGAGGYPGVALARDALALVSGRMVNAAADPFALSAPQSSSFRFDWRRDYIPIDAGFSLNKHPSIRAVGFPLVELLAAIGLTHARPNRHNKLEYRYAVVGRAERAHDFWFPPSLLRLALGAAALPFPMRHFCMRLGWPAKEGQMRAITTVTEETPA